MGVDFALFERLVDLSTRFQPKGRTLMLGRQNSGLKRALLNTTKKRFVVLKSTKEDSRFCKKMGTAKRCLRSLDLVRWKRWTSLATKARASCMT